MSLGNVNDNIGVLHLHMLPHEPSFNEVPARYQSPAPITCTRRPSSSFNKCGMVIMVTLISTLPTTEVIHKKKDIDTFNGGRCCIYRSLPCFQPSCNYTAQELLSLYYRLLCSIFVDVAMATDSALVFTSEVLVFTQLEPGSITR